MRVDAAKPFSRIRRRTRSFEVRKPAWRSRAKDEVDGNVSAGDLSLREAVGLANARAGADRIVFDPAVFDGGAGALIRLTEGVIGITGALAITGGQAGVTITGDANGDDVARSGGITDVGNSSMSDNSQIFDVTRTGASASSSGASTSTNRWRPPAPGRGG